MQGLGECKRSRASCYTELALCILFTWYKPLHQKRMPAIATSSANPSLPPFMSTQNSELKPALKMRRSCFSSMRCAQRLVQQRSRRCATTWHLALCLFRGSQAMGVQARRSQVRGAGGLTHSEGQAKHAKQGTQSA
jgi:hypothetical protein